RAVLRDLHRRILLVEVRHGIERAEQHHDHDEGIFPAGKFEHCRYRLAKGGAPPGGRSPTWPGNRHGITPSADGPRWWFAASGRLERALGQDVADGTALHADLDAVGDLDGHETLAQRAHHPGDAAAGDHLVAHRQLVEHGAVFL